MFPRALGRAQRGQGNFLGPLSSPQPPELGWGEPGAQVWVFSSSGGKFSPNQSPGASSQREPGSRHREGQDGDPVSPREEQEGEWMSPGEEWGGECVSPFRAGGHREAQRGGTRVSPMPEALQDLGSLPAVTPLLPVPGSDLCCSGWFCRVLLTPFSPLCCLCHGKAAALPPHSSFWVDKA